MGLSTRRIVPAAPRANDVVADGMGPRRRRCSRRRGRRRCLRWAIPSVRGARAQRRGRPRLGHTDTGTSRTGHASGVSGATATRASGRRRSHQRHPGNANCRRRVATATTRARAARETRPRRESRDLPGARRRAALHRLRAPTSRARNVAGVAVAGVGVPRRFETMDAGGLCKPGSRGMPRQRTCRCGERGEQGDVQRAQPRVSTKPNCARNSVSGGDPHLLRVGDLDLPTARLEPVVHEARSAHRLEQ
jgi:hypothetical protein